MTDAEVLAVIASVAREHLEWQGGVRPEMRLVEELRLDSIKLLTLAIELENRFRIHLDDEDESGIETVGDLVAAIRRRLEDRDPWPVARGPRDGDAEGRG